MPLVTVREFDPEGFLREAGPMLEAEEAANNLLLALPAEAALKVAVPGGPKPYFAVVYEDGERAGAAGMIPPGFLLLPATGACVLIGLLDHLAAAGVQVPGVCGYTGTARMFAAYWMAKTGLPMHEEPALRIMEATSVAPPAAVPGRLREATDADEDLLTSWRLEYRAHHCGTGADAAGEARGWVRRFTAAGRLYIWDDGGPRCMAGWDRPTSHGACVVSVFTPVPERRRGYGAACVAALTRYLLDGGRRFACLLVNAGNAPAISVYAKLGYRPVCDLASFSFRPGR
jgi:hypothetical protein